MKHRRKNEDEKLYLRFKTEDIALEQIQVDQDLIRKFHNSPSEDFLASIKKDGIMDPVMVCRHGEGFCLIDGYKRFVACKNLGMKTIPARVYRHKFSELEINAAMHFFNSEKRDSIWKGYLCFRYMKLVTGVKTPSEAIYKLKLYRNQIHPCPSDYVAIYFLHILNGAQSKPKYIESRIKRFVRKFGQKRIVCKISGWRNCQNLKVDWSKFYTFLGRLIVTEYR